MSILTGDGYIGSAKQNIPYKKTTARTTIANIPFSLLNIAGLPSAGVMSIGNTSAGVVPTDATAGYPPINTFGGGAKGYLSRIGFGSTVACRFQVWDRLWNSGSHLLQTLRTDTITTPPSYSGRLPNTDYKGLFIIIEVAVAISAQAVTVTVNYTNQDGTAGRTTGSSGSLSGFTLGRLIVMPLQAGDSGVQKIDSVVIGGVLATTGSVNIIVARLLASSLRVISAGFADVLGLDRTGLPEIFDTSALWVTVEADSTSSGVPDLFLEVANA